MSRREVLWHLTVHTEHINGVAVLTASGRVSRATAPLLAEPLTRAAAESGHVVLDLSGIDYLNSAGLHVLEAAAARLEAAGGALIVCALHEAIGPVFELAGPIPHLVIAPSRAEALERASTPRLESPGTQS